MKRGTATALLAAIASTGAARASDTPPLTPETLDRLAPSVVKVRSGDDWQTGFVFGSPRTVVTSYSVANESGSIEVVGADQKVHDARVVAWSKEDDLALLELTDDAGPPLITATELPWAPAPMAVLYEPQEPDPDSRIAKTWNVPIVLRGSVGRVFPKELDIDVNLWGRPGDFGAPVVTPSGQVIGIVSEHAMEKRRAIATRIEPAERLLAMRGRQGTFSRTRRTTLFGGFQITPIATKRFVGAGLAAGLRYDWFALELVDSVYQRGYRPIDDAQSEATTRLQAELYAECAETTRRDA